MNKPTSARFPATSMPDHDWWSALWPEPEKVLHLIGIDPGMTVLDLCCGDGYFTAALAQYTGGKVYAVDLDASMLEKAREVVTRQGASTLGWICADARDIANLLPEPVDYVLLANTFHGVPDPGGLVNAIHKVLRPHGQLVIVNWLPLPREETTVLGLPRGPATAMRMAPEEVQMVVEPQGYRTIRTVGLAPYHYAITFEAVTNDAIDTHGPEEQQ